MPPSPFLCLRANLRLVFSLIADICNVPVQLPHSHSASVVLGSAMLGAAAAREAAEGPIIKTQEQAEKGSFAMKDRLWDIMVRLSSRLAFAVAELTILSSPSLAQIKMSKPGTTVKPSASEKELRLLKVKYETFLECIELQRKWRKNVSQALEE